MSFSRTFVWNFRIQMKRRAASTANPIEPPVTATIIIVVDMLVDAVLI